MLAGVGHAIADIDVLRTKTTWSRRQRRGWRWTSSARSGSSGSSKPGPGHGAAVGLAGVEGRRLRFPSTWPWVVTAIVTAFERRRYLDRPRRVAPNPSPTDLDHGELPDALLPWAPPCWLCLAQVGP